MIHIIVEEKIKKTGRDAPQEAKDKANEIIGQLKTNPKSVEIKKLHSEKRSIKLKSGWRLLGKFHPKRKKEEKHIVWDRMYEHDEYETNYMK